MDMPVKYIIKIDNMYLNELLFYGCIIVTPVICYFRNLEQ